MVKARQAFFTRTGGPEVIEWRDAELGEPGPGEVLVEQHAIGLNFIDTYHRAGLYPVRLPSAIGMEGAGVVAAVGEGVAGLEIGQRVGVVAARLGSYADYRLVPAASVVPLPAGVSAEVAASSLLKGQTAEYLIERCARVQPGSTVLVHACAGGTGQLIAQWLGHVGVTVIGTVGSAEKERAAREVGVNHVVRYDLDDTAAAVRELTNGEGVPVVFDGVGAPTWESSLASCARRGLVVSFGNAGGPVTGIGLAALAAAGSLYVTRPTWADYYADPREAAAGTARWFAMLESGAVRPRIGRYYRLAEAALAHRDLEARKTVGSSILIPDRT
jgi:NADPH2:quinone reductase